MNPLRRRRSPYALALLVLGLTAALAVPASAPAVAAVPNSPGPNVLIAGSGWGHSVGMSQYGARAMAQQGKTATQILTHYYTGVTVAPDSRVPNSKEVRVDLYLAKPSAGSQRVDLRPIGAFDPAGGVTSPVFIDVAGDVRQIPPSGDGWWVSHDPAGGRYVVHSGGDEVYSGSDAQPVRVYAQPSGSNPSAIRVQNGTTYIGTYQWGVLSISGPGNGSLNPVLIQPMQNYLWGLGEVPASWEEGVLRAQAITGRTYAGRIGGTLSTTPTHQAYNGWDRERSGNAAWKAAVDGTAGIAVTYNGELAQTYYSSSHGLGRSENSEDSWAYGATIPYLRSVADPYSGASGNGNPYNSWTATASNGAFASVMGLARVNSVRILSRTAGGSPKAIEVNGWKPDGARITCTWSGGSAPCQDNSSTQKGAGAKLRLDLPLVAGGSTNGRIRSQQISAITIAPFNDDEGSLHQYNIGAVAAAGITSGCTATAYCPTAAIQRGQMAVFMARSIGLAPDNGPDAFNDIAASPFRGYINALARAGRIGGYSDGSYRPLNTVPRDQMATFLVRTFDVPPASGGDRFDDIAASVHRDSINATAARGLTSGCTATKYCPTGQVSREQMATFIARATGLGE